MKFKVGIVTSPFFLVLNVKTETLLPSAVFIIALKVEPLGTAGITSCKVFPLVIPRDFVLLTILDVVLGLLVTFKISKNEFVPVGDGDGEGGGVSIADGEGVLLGFAVGA